MSRSENSVVDLGKDSGKQLSATISLFSIRPTYNSQVAEAQLNWKPLQLYYASRSDLKTPRTLISSSKDEVLDFISTLAAEGKDVIYKQVVSTPDGPQTRLFCAEDLDRATDIALCPTIFQERLKGGPDLRIMVVGNSVFAAEWRREHDPQPVVDIRADSMASLWPTQLTDQFTSRLVKLHRQFGLSLGVYDFKMDSEGTPYFLEVNPRGRSSKRGRTQRSPLVLGSLSLYRISNEQKVVLWMRSASFALKRNALQPNRISRFQTNRSLVEHSRR